MVATADKIHVSAHRLNVQSVRLARAVWNDGFRPDFLIGLWRGGTPPGIILHEYLRMRGVEPYHTTIKTQSYRGLERGDGGVDIRGLDHVIEAVEAEHQLLLVDDVFDTGHTLAAVLETIRSRTRRNCPECRTATVYYKPLRNETEITPDYWVVETDDWIVFPHELEGLTEAEIRAKGDAVAAAVLGDD